MDVADNFNTNNCHQVILVTTDDWADGMPLGECNNHMVLYTSFINSLDDVYFA